MIKAGLKTRRMIKAMVEAILSTAGASPRTTPLALFRAIHGAESVRVHDYGREVGAYTMPAPQGLYLVARDGVTLSAPAKRLCLLVQRGSTPAEMQRAAARALARHAVDDIAEGLNEAEQAAVLAGVESALMDPSTRAA